MELILAEDVSNMTLWHLVTVYRKASRGEIPGVIKLGKSLRFDKAEVERWLESRKRDVSRDD
jgi:excisionase family DNA binding protein